MKRFAIMVAGLCAFSGAGAAPTPVEQLLKPPADAAHWVFVSEAGKHGDQYRWKLANGCTAYRDSSNLRGWTTEVDQIVCYAGQPVPVKTIVRGKTGLGTAEEGFTVANGVATWRTETESGSAPFDGSRFYFPANGTILSYSEQILAMQKAKDGKLALLPSGFASTMPMSKIIVDGPQGKKEITLNFVTGLATNPIPIWLDRNGDFFGYFQTLGLLPAGYEGAIAPMKEAQAKAGLNLTRAISAKYRTDAARAPILFRNITLFDADAGTFRPNMAVLVRDGKIAAVGSAAAIVRPGNVREIDGTGLSLVPGLWDSHAHFGEEDWKLLQNISTGITGYRSPGAEIEYVLDKKKRAEAGELLAPDMRVSVIIDRKHPLQAQGALTVSSKDEAIAAVRKIHDAGLYGVKFYTSMEPAWIAPAAAEAHRLGLHVSGHVPATMRPLDAVRAGYDEITHINFAMMQFMPQSVVDKANTNQRMEGPLRYAKDVDLADPAARSFIAELARRGTIVDPTVTIFEDQMAAPQDGSLPPSVRPYEGLFPAAVERSLRGGGYPLLEGMTREDFTQSYRKLLELIGKLHAAGVPIVAGTDGQGYELQREIENYEIAGLSKADAIASATIVAARVAGVDDRTGSIRVGKEADMILVDGDVSKDLGALRRVRTVVTDGYVIDAAALRRDVGITGDPK